MTPARKAFWVNQVQFWVGLTVFVVGAANASEMADAVASGVMGEVELPLGALLSTGLAGVLVLDALLWQAERRS